MPCNPDRRAQSVGCCQATASQQGPCQHALHAAVSAATQIGAPPPLRLLLLGVCKHSVRSQLHTPIFQNAAACTLLTWVAACVDGAAKLNALHPTLSKPVNTHQCIAGHAARSALGEAQHCWGKGACVHVATQHPQHPLQSAKVECTCQGELRAQGHAAGATLRPISQGRPQVLLLNSKT